MYHYTATLRPAGRLSDMQVQLLADSFFVGVQGVAEAYPQCVQVLDRRERRAEALTAEKQGEDPAKNGQKL